jgi:DNA-binding MarR family transcriptional regulator
MARYQDLAHTMVAECPAMRVARTTRVLARVFNDEFRAIGLQVSQHGVLTFVALAGKDGATIGTLADEMVLDPTTLTRNLRPLQKAGYLTLTRSPKDGRAQIVSLTKKGQKTIEAIFPLWQRAYGRLQDALGPRSLAELRDHLDQATAAVTASKPGK